MIAPMSADQFSLDTRILDLAARGIPRFGAQSARKLALALAEISPGKDINNVKVADLLGYLPARYEDRSSMVEIRHRSNSGCINSKSVESISNAPAARS